MQSAIQQKRFRLCTMTRELAAFDTPREMLDFVIEHPQYCYSIQVADNVSLAETEEIRLNWRRKD